MTLELLKQLSLAIFGILPGNYSGITHIAGNDYAIVDDKNMTDGFMIMSLDTDSLGKGKVIAAELREPVGMSERRQTRTGTYRDCEGIAYCNATNTLFVSGEEDQRILEYTLEGIPTGRELEVPQHMNRSAIRPNLGFEALAYNANTQRFWTTTESTLPSDGEYSTLTSKDVRNRLRFMSFGLSLKPIDEYLYEMDTPTVKRKKGTLAHGVPSLVALDDGSLIVMEREAFVAKKKVGSFCRIKLFHAIPDNGIMRKEKLAEFVTCLRIGKMNFANYEGMCLGPRLADGRQTLLLISDSQNGAGNSLFHLKDYLKVVIINSL